MKFVIILLAVVAIVAAASGCPTGSVTCDDDPRFNATINVSVSNVTIRIIGARMAELENVELDKILAGSCNTQVNITKSGPNDMLMMTTLDYSNCNDKRDPEKLVDFIIVYSYVIPTLIALIFVIWIFKLAIAKQELEERERVMNMKSRPKQSHIIYAFKPTSANFGQFQGIRVYGSKV